MSGEQPMNISRPSTPVPTSTSHEPRAFRERTPAVGDDYDMDEEYMDEEDWYKHPDDKDDLVILETDWENRKFRYEDILKNLAGRIKRANGRNDTAAANEWKTKQTEFRRAMRKEEDMWNNRGCPQLAGMCTPPPHCACTNRFAQQ